MSKFGNCIRKLLNMLPVKSLNPPSRTRLKSARGKLGVPSTSAGKKLEDLSVPTGVVCLDSLPRHKTKRYKTRKPSDITGIVVHTTDMFRPSINELAEYHIGRNHISATGCPELAYHDVVTDRKVYMCVNYNKISWHAAGYNKNNIAVALHYKCRDNDPSKTPLAPPENMVKILHTHLTNLCMDFRIPPYNIKGHRELQGTGWFWQKGSRRLKKECPGLMCDLDKLRMNVTKIMQIKLFSLGYYRSDIDGIYGPLTEAALDCYYND